MTVDDKKLNKNSYLRNPFNYLFGTESHVSILRLLALRSKPMSAPTIGTEVNLSARGTRLALASLEDTGIVECTGSNRSKLYRVSDSHPLAHVITTLFREEASRFTRLISSLKELFVGIAPKVISAWVSGDVAMERDGPSSEFNLCFLAMDADIAMIEEKVLDMTLALQKEHRIDICVSAFSRADLIADPNKVRDEGVHLLYGVAPNAVLESGARSRRAKPSHANFDQDGLARGREIAMYLRKNPSAIQDALAFIEESARKCSAGERKTLMEWKRLLESGTLAQICRLLEDDGERGTRLRQSLPFQR